MWKYVTYCTCCRAPIKATFFLPFDNELLGNVCEECDYRLKLCVKLLKLCADAEGVVYSPNPKNRFS